MASNRPLMVRRRAGASLAALALALAPSLGPAPSYSEREAAVRVISRWDSDCSGEKVSSWDEMITGWYDAVTDDRASPDGHGGEAFRRMDFKHNGKIVDSDFTDKAEVSWGKDHTSKRPDDVDAFAIALHGGDYGANDRWQGSVRVNESGFGNCKTKQGDILWGNGDAEFILMSSCNSMDKENWWPEWNDSFDGLHQIQAFHGIMWIKEARSKRYSDFADDAFEGSLVDAFIDNLYEVDVKDGHDQCPVPRGVGTDEDDLWDRMDHERYNDVFSSDPPGEGEDRWHGVVYVDGCDPKSKGAL